MGLPVLRALSLCTCCRQYPGAATGRRLRSSHPAVSAFPEIAVGSACTSTFSRLAQRSLALRPAHSRRHLYVTCYTEGFSHFVTSMTAPVASGWSGCRVGLAPTGKRRLVTAHANSGHSPTTSDRAKSDPRRNLHATPARLATSAGSGLPLSVKRVELLFEPIVSRHASVDRATLRLLGERLHWTLSPASVVALTDGDDEPSAARGRVPDWPRARALDLSLRSIRFGSSSQSLARMRSRHPTPKNRWPFHFVPVMAKATADRLE